MTDVSSPATNGQLLESLSSASSVRSWPWASGAHRRNPTKHQKYKASELCAVNVVLTASNDGKLGMCTALFAFGVHPTLLFFLAFNRDEFFDR